MNRQDQERFLQRIAAGDVVIVTQDDALLATCERDNPGLVTVFAKRPGNHLDEIAQATRDGIILWCNSHKDAHLLTWQDYHQGLGREVPRLTILCLDGVSHLRTSAPGERLEGKAHFIQAIVRSDGPIVQSD